MQDEVECVVGMHQRWLFDYYKRLVAGKLRKKEKSIFWERLASYPTRLSIEEGGSSNSLFATANSYIPDAGSSIEFLLAFTAPDERVEMDFDDFLKIVKNNLFMERLELYALHTYGTRDAVDYILETGCM